MFSIYCIDLFFNIKEVCVISQTHDFISFLSFHWNLIW